MLESGCLAIERSRRSVIVILATAVLVAAGLWLHPPRAFAAPSVAASSVDAGQKSTITVNGCSDSTLYGGATYTIADSAGAVVGQGAVEEWTFTWSSADPDLYTVTVTCQGKDSVADASASTTFALWPTFIDISPDAWTLGDPITLQAVGFTPGEKVSLRLTSDSSTAAISSWATTSVVDDNALWTFDVVLPKDLKVGVYQVVATGAQSGVTRTGGFRIVDNGVASPTPSARPTSSTPSASSSAATGAGASPSTSPSSSDTGTSSTPGTPPTSGGLPNTGD